MAKATQLAIYKRYKETFNTKGTTDTKVSVPVLFWNTVQIQVAVMFVVLFISVHENSLKGTAWLEELQ